MSNLYSINTTQFASDVLPSTKRTTENKSFLGGLIIPSSILFKLVPNLTIGDLSGDSIPLFGFVPWLIEDKTKMESFKLKSHVIPQNEKNRIFITVTSNGNGSREACYRSSETNRKVRY